MNNDINEHIIIRNSSNKSFVFYRNDENKLIFQEEKVDERDIIDFSMAIDKDDKIHLIYLLGNGELMYGIYVDGIWKKNLVLKLNTKSNIYKYLNLLIHEDHINIFYAFSNLINTNLWTIEHIFKDVMQWRKKTVVNIYTEKKFKPFFMDNDKLGNISLIYRAQEYTAEHIYYLNYNIFIKEWSKNSAKISYSEADNIYPYLFIDRKDNIHVLWYSLDKDQHYITYKRLSQTGRNKYHWVEVQIPKIPCANYYPIISQKEDKLNIICIAEDEMTSLSSKNYGLNWNLENKILVKDQKFHLIKYISNPSTNDDGKKNHFYGDINENGHFYYDENLNKMIMTTANDLEINNSDKLDNETVENNQQEDLKAQQVENTSINGEGLTELKELKDMVHELRGELESLKESVSNIEKKQKAKRRFFNMK